MMAAQQQKWLEPETLNVVRPEVRNILDATPAYKKLSPDEQKQIARSMVKVAAYMSNPDGLADKAFEPDGNGVLVRAQADDPTTIAGRRAAQDPGFAGEDFEAGAVRQGVEEFGRMVQKVDFPKFVSGLIQGVFQAIVESSIQQMQAYGQLLANVAKSVDQFAQDNITENNARDWMQERYPDVFSLEESSGDDFGFGFAEGEEAPQPQAKLAVVAEDETAALQRVSNDLGLAQPITSISDPDSELKIVTAARLEIARGRQQLLASMVMLGINRIVVTDGLIHAKVVFDMRASDQAARRSRASLYDKDSVKTQTRTSARYGGWYSPFRASINSQVDTEHMTTVQSSLDETSESRADVKAKLSGEVRVNFKSDFLPMERMATPQMIAAIQGNAEPKDANVPGEQQ